MIKQVGSSLKQTAKQTAKQVAKQLAQEPFEILKTAGKQVGATSEATGEKPLNSQRPQPQVQGNETEPTVSQEKREKQVKSQRLMQAYEKELEDIRRQEKQKELEKEQVEYYAEQQKVEQSKAKKENIIQVISKKGRRMFGKVGLKREQTKVEMRQPPSS